MCRLFGMISKKPQSAKHWFFNTQIPLIDFSKKVINKGPHNSGWGIATISKRKWTIFKEGIGSVNKYNFNNIKKNSSKITLIHLRRASVGNETTENAHPFKYKNWVFEHNGNINRKKHFYHLNKKFQNKLTSQTDSEVYFYLIMQFFEKNKDIIKSIKHVVGLVKKYSPKGLNFIMSNGEKLYAYRDMGKDYESELKDYYCLNYLVKKDEVVVSSDPLSNENWKLLNIGELLIIDSSLKIETKKLFS
jgi:glutamine amidotransferase